MCLEERHIFNLDQLVDYLQTNNLEDASFLGVDFNDWEPHVKTSINILESLSVSGFRCFYFQSGFGLFPQFGKPYFGKRSKLNKGILDSIDLNVLVVEEKKAKFTFISESDKNHMQANLMKVSNGKELSNLSLNDLDFGYAVLSTICSLYGRGDISKELIQRVGPKVLNSYINTFNCMYYYLKKLEIKFLVVFNGRFVNEKAAVSAARHLGIRIIYHEASRNNSYSLSCFSPHSITGYKKLTAALTENVDSKDISRDSISWYRSRITGSNPDSAHFQSKWEYFDDFPRQVSLARKRISIFTTSDDEYLGLSEDWDLPQKQSQREWITKIAKIALKHEYEVILRLHPNLKTKSKSLQKEWMQLADIEGITIIGFADRYNSYNLVKSSDLIVTCGSTIAMEAGFLGKPVLSVGTGIYDALNAVRKVQDLDLLEDMLKRGEFDFLVPDRMAIELFGYTEQNKFTRLSSDLFENWKISGVFVKPSFINRVFSRIYRDLMFRLL
jgi:hypothetical protein